MCGYFTIFVMEILCGLNASCTRRTRTFTEEPLMKTLNNLALEKPLKNALRQAEHGGVVIKRKGKRDYALLPLNDDLLDYLLETSPKLIEECKEITKRMEAG